MWGDIIFLIKRSSSLLLFLDILLLVFGFYFLDFSFEDLFFTSDSNIFEKLAS